MLYSKRVFPSLKLTRLGVWNTWGKNKIKIYGLKGILHLQRMEHYKSSKWQLLLQHYTNLHFKWEKNEDIQQLHLQDDNKKQIHPE